ncbi:MAG TPA: hypothetical protein VMT11_05395 [Myxococcaceae bacterium]|nr:hypothetical protein [Myxococcaceae bacterium]
MMRNLGGVLGGALLALAACGPMDDGGGGVVGAPCTTDGQCASDGCCGNGVNAVAASQRPSCPASCANGQDPYSPYVRNGCGLVSCSGYHCGVALTVGPGC